jgi:hypothetical protein
LVPLVQLPGDKSKRVFPVEVDLAEVGGRISKEIAAMEKEGGITFVMRPDYIDAGAVSIVAFIQDSKTKAILAAARLHAQDAETRSSQKTGNSDGEVPQ